jgi:hypothetical protein
MAAFGDSLAIPGAAACGRNEPVELARWYQASGKTGRRLDRFQERLLARLVVSVRYRGLSATDLVAPAHDGHAVSRRHYRPHHRHSATPRFVGGDRVDRGCRRLDYRLDTSLPLCSISWRLLLGVPHLGPGRGPIFADLASRSPNRIHVGYSANFMATRDSHVDQTRHARHRCVVAYRRLRRHCRRSAWSLVLDTCPPRPSRS